MYHKALSILSLVNILFLAAFFAVRMESINEAIPVGSYLETECAEQARGRMEINLLKNLVSGQRVLAYSVVKEDEIELDEQEIEILQRIVEAEAGGEDADGKLLVANVVMNRVRSDRFPDSVKEVVFQKSNGVTQFSPISDGRYYSVHISEETIEAVDKALLGEDISEGALFFASRKYASAEKIKWFDDNLDFLFNHGGHDFFR